MHSSSGTPCSSLLRVCTRRSRIPLAEMSHSNTPGRRSTLCARSRSRWLPGSSGANGSGKSTILKLIVRLYDPDEGQILVGGHDIRTFKLFDLRQAISVLFQDYTHFSLSVSPIHRCPRFMFLLLLHGQLTRRSTCRFTTTSPSETPLPPETMNTSDSLAPRRHRRLHQQAPGRVQHISRPPHA